MPVLREEEQKRFREGFNKVLIQNKTAALVLEPLQTFCQIPYMIIGQVKHINANVHSWVKKEITKSPFSHKYFKC